MQPVVKVLSFILLLFSVALAEDKIKLKKSYITGEIVNADQSSIWIATDFAGTIRVERSKILDLETDKLFYIQLMNGNNTRGKVEFSSEREVKVTGESNFPFVIPSKDIYKMTPIKGYDADKPSVTKLRAGAMVREKTGNKDKNEIDLYFKLNVDRIFDELSLMIDTEYETSGGETKDDEVDIVGSYKYFLDDSDFVYARLEGERDKTDELDLRGTVAAGYGYYWYKSALLSFETRFGLQYRHTSYEDQPSASQEAFDMGAAVSYQINDYTQFTTDVNFAPRISEPEIYLLKYTSSLEFELGNSSDWFLQLGVDQELSTEEEREAEDYDLEAFIRLIYEFN